MCIPQVRHIDSSSREEGSGSLRLWCSLETAGYKLHPRLPLTAVALRKVRPPSNRYGDLRRSATAIRFFKLSSADDLRMLHAKRVGSSSSPPDSPAAHRRHPALELIKRRLDEGSRPGRRSDGCKLGLVVEGGGMRGIISGAMLMGLLGLGLRDTFDAVYGASAGAINSTYFLSGQPHGLGIYTEDLLDGRFLNLPALMVPRWAKLRLRQLRRASWARQRQQRQQEAEEGADDEAEGGRVLGAGPPSTSRSAAAGETGAIGKSLRRPAMDLSYILDHVMHVVRPLDWSAVLHSPIPLKVVASSLDLLQPVLLDSFSSPDDLSECLAASANVPAMAGPPRVVRGQRCVDAAVFEPVPVASAVRDGCTHVLVLCTRTAPACSGAGTGLLTPAVAKAASSALATVVKRTLLNARYMNEAWRISCSAAQREEEDAVYDRPDRLGAHVLPLYPATVAGVNPVSMNVAKLVAARNEGFRAVDVHLAGPLGLRPPVPSGSTREWWESAVASSGVKGVKGVRKARVEESQEEARGAGAMVGDCWSEGPGLQAARSASRASLRGRRGGDAVTSVPVPPCIASLGGRRGCGAVAIVPVPLCRAPLPVRA